MKTAAALIFVLAVLILGIVVALEHQSQKLELHGGTR